MKVSSSALRQVNLRTPSSSSTKGASTTTPSTLADDIAREKEQNVRLRACDLDAWYHRLSDATFRTTFVAISPAEARALMASYHSKRELSSSCGSAPARRPLPVSLEQRDLLIHLEERIAREMEALGSPAVFAKLSSRSPKDSRFCEARALKRVKARLLSVREAGGVVDTNAVLTATMACGIQSLRLTSASDVIECFTTSDRVCEDDLPLALDFPDAWSQHIVLREWVTIPSAFEFRGFVIDNKLTALSQYFSGAFFPDLVEKKEEVVLLIQRFFVEEVRDRVGLEPSDYVVDFAVDPVAWRAYVIELNPFGRPSGMGTGTPLFDMKDPRDRAVLFGDASDSFEFRVETSLPTTPLTSLLREGPLKQWLVREQLL